MSKNSGVDLQKYVAKQKTIHVLNLNNKEWTTGRTNQWTEWQKHIPIAYFIIMILSYKVLWLDQTIQVKGIKSYISVCFHARKDVSARFYN